MASFTRHAIPTFETDRLILRPATLDDAPRIQHLFNNINVLKYMAKAIPWPYPENGAMEFLEGVLDRVAAGDEFYWAILEKDSQKQGLIGVISLSPGSDTDNRGFWLGEPYWGLGYMTEACTVVNDFAFNVLKMKEMMLNNAEPNTGSHRLKEKAGAEIVSIQDCEYVSGTYPQVRWKLTAEQWEKNRERFMAD